MEIFAIMNFDWQICQNLAIGSIAGSKINCLISISIGYENFHMNLVNKIKLDLIYLLEWHEHFLKSMHICAVYCACNFLKTYEALAIL